MDGLSIINKHLYAGVSASYVENIKKAMSDFYHKYKINGSNKNVAADFFSLRTNTFGESVSLRIPRIERKIDKNSSETESIYDPKVLSKFFLYIELCRRYGIMQSWAEPQDANCSGLMLDFDIKTETKINSFSNKMFVSLIRKITSIIVEKCSIVNNTSFKVGIIGKTQPINKDRKYKTGFHMLFPTIGLSRKSKRYIVDTLADSDEIGKTLKKYIFEDDEEYKDKDCKEISNEIVDRNSYKVPVFFIGSLSKPEALLAYELHSIYDINIKFLNQMNDSDDSNDEDNDFNRNNSDIYESRPNVSNMNVIISVKEDTKTKENSKNLYLETLLDEERKEEIVINKVEDNICEMFSLTANNSKIKYMTQKDYEVDAKASEEVNNDILVDEVINDNDPIKNDLKKYLDLINFQNSERFSYGYYKLLDNVLKINSSYKELLRPYICEVEQFKNKPSRFDDLWKTILNNNRNVDDLTKEIAFRTIKEWASEDNYEECCKVRDNDISIILANALTQDRNAIYNHVLHALFLMFKDKFLCVEEKGEIVWYEYVSLSDMKKKEYYLNKNCNAFCWILTTTKKNDIPNLIQFYLTDPSKGGFSTLLNNISKRLEMFKSTGKKVSNAKVKVSMQEKMANDEIAAMKKSVNDCIKNIYSKANKQLHVNFVKNYFKYQVDSYPNVIAIRNAIMILPNKEKELTDPNEKWKRPLIIRDNSNQYFLNQFMPSDYKEFDPNDPLTKKIFMFFRTLFHDNNTDSFEFLLFVLCSSLDKYDKESYIITCEGNGNNGKTLMVELHSNATGPFTTKLQSTFLTQKTEADRPSPNTMQMKNATLCYYSETEKGEAINEARVKEVTGNEKISSRDLNKTLETFKPKCVHMVTSNYMLRITNNDNGIWRRIINIHFDIIFKHKEEYDELKSSGTDMRNYKVADQTIQTWLHTQDSYDRYLGILGVFYTIWKAKYNGKLANISKPNIDMATKNVKEKNNIFDKFLKRRCVVITNNPDAETIPIESIVDKYADFFKITESKKPKIVEKATDPQIVIETILESSIKKYIISNHGIHIIRGLRFLKADNSELREEDGEVMLSDLLEKRINKSIKKEVQVLTPEGSWQKFISEWRYYYLGEGHPNKSNLHNETLEDILKNEYEEKNDIPVKKNTTKKHSEMESLDLMDIVSSNNSEMSSSLSAIELPVRKYKKTKESIKKMFNMTEDYSSEYLLSDIKDYTIYKN